MLQEELNVCAVCIVHGMFCNGEKMDLGVWGLLH